MQEVSGSIPLRSTSSRRRKAPLGAFFFLMPLWGRRAGTRRVSGLQFGIVVPMTSQSASRHKCLIYDGDPSEQLSVVVPFLAEGRGATFLFTLPA